MVNWMMSLPVPVEFGTDSLQKLEKYLDEGRKALVVTGRHAMKATGVTERLCDLLEATGVECLLLDKVHPIEKAKVTGIAYVWDMTIYQDCRKVTKLQEGISFVQALTGESMVI
jgi:alcohol dehydrogenase YqhD (iron-dependent ADH family)